MDNFLAANKTATGPCGIACWAQPDNGHKGMMTGINMFRDSAQCSHLHRLLLMPFAGKITGCAINSRNRTAADES